MPTYNTINEYRIMWLFVFFDLPVTTKKQRSEATHFRNDLLEDGFTMMQFSIYTRHCPSRETADVHVKRVNSFTPPEGQVSVLCVTDRQYSDIINIWGKKEKPLPPGPVQLELL